MNYESRINYDEYASEVLHDAWACWESLYLVRKEADRNKMYVFGDQWGDKVNTEYGVMTEREYIIKQGNLPVTNNRLRGILRTISGLFQNNQTEPVCIARERNSQVKGELMTMTLQYVYQLNRIWSLDVANLTNLLISGAAIFKTGYGYKNGVEDAWCDNIDINRFFFDSDIEDVRQWDVSLCGEIEDISIWDVLARYGEGDSMKIERLKNIYGKGTRRLMENSISNGYSRDVAKYRDFYIPDNPSKCRVITVWRKEAKSRYLVHDRLNGDLYKVEMDEQGLIEGENNRRIAAQSAAGVLPEDMKLLEANEIIDTYWYYYHLSPTGAVLKKGETEYWHGSHPYSFKFYSFYNKQIIPFVSGIRDQQRYVNRLIMMQDFIMRASAKGVLMVPLSALEGTGKTPEEFAADYVKFNGVLFYNEKVGVSPPHQVTSNATALGIYDMLSIQLKMLDEVSNVTDALQGRSPHAGTPAALFAQQMQQSSTSLQEIFEMYRICREERDLKMLKLIQQYYKDARYIGVSGKKDVLEYSPQDVQRTQFHLSIEESSSTPVYRMANNELLWNLNQAGQISLEIMLEAGNFPFADRLLELLKQRNEQMGVSSGDIPPEIMQQIQAETNPALN
jgi:hypothetical protein